MKVHVVVTGLESTERVDICLYHVLTRESERAEKRLLGGCPDASRVSHSLFFIREIDRVRARGPILMPEGGLECARNDGTEHSLR